MIPILEHLIHNEFSINDSFNFDKENTTYDSSPYMASLDVESLFTNIPLNERINNCVSHQYNKNLCSGKLSKRDPSKLPETETTESSFIFDYLLYKQVHGVTMGCSLRHPLANAFLGHYEKEWLDNCAIYLKPLIYKRHVDDVFILFSSKERL